MVQGPGRNGVTLCTPGPLFPGVQPITGTFLEVQLIKGTFPEVQPIMETFPKVPLITETFPGVQLIMETFPGGTSFIFRSPETSAIYRRIRS